MTARNNWLLAAILAGAAAWVAPAFARPLDDVKASGVLTVILYDDNEPFSFDKGGVATGIEADLARAVAAKLGVKAEITLRMQGEQVDTDLRTNVVRGTFGGGIAGDVMFHVPVDRELFQRVGEAVISNSYFKQRVALGLHPDRQGGPVASFDVFKSEPIGVQLGTVSDYFLMRYEGGTLVNNVKHYVRPMQGAQRFAAKDFQAILGVQSSLEALFKSRGLTAQWSTPPMPGLVRESWVLGTAVNERSRDLGYAIGNALTELAADGTLAKICATYGVTYVPPIP